jgi:16S rRNA (uracil1498-N3)-methyltransferase
MPRYDFTSQRLFMDVPLSAGNTVELDRGQANYLLNVLRLGDGDHVLVFNGRDGEWRADIVPQGRKKAALAIAEQTRPQPAAYDLVYLFAPLKQARMEYMVQKAVEMGAGHLQPVFTDFTQLRKINAEKMHLQAVEAAEQCGILTIPEVNELQPLDAALDDIAHERTIVFCDEGCASQNPLPVLQGIKSKKLAVLVGPEGGFSQEEREMLKARKNVVAIPLGPRVLRADTAAVAALAMVQSVLGDWHD